MFNFRRQNVNMNASMLLLALAVFFLLQFSNKSDWKSTASVKYATQREKNNSRDNNNATNNSFNLLAIVPTDFRLVDDFKLAADDSSSVAPLRDIHLVMVGDSLMRYQYLSLVYRLRYGIWFDTAQWRFNIVCEKSFENPFHTDTWGEFLFQTNGKLHPYEVCDCYRKPSKWMEDIMENRYYYDPRFNNSVVFLLAYGHRFPQFGRLKPGEVRNQTADWQLQAFRELKNKKSCWYYYDWADLIRHHIRHLDPQPRHVLLNAGIFPNRFGWSKAPTWNESGEVSPETINLTEAIKETPQFHFAWRTTTYSKNREYSANATDHFMCELLQTCIDVSFTKRMPRSMFWDLGHLEEPYYRAVNEDMLHKFGYLPDNYMRMNLSDILE